MTLATFPIPTCRGLRGHAYRGMQSWICATYDYEEFLADRESDWLRGHV